MITIDSPRWGNNVQAGYVGLVSRKGDFISAGIDWFERWDRLPGDPPVSHAFGIIAESSLSSATPADDWVTIEAFSSGVAKGSLNAYLDDPDVALLVRKPLSYSADLGSRIVSELQRHVDESYDFALIGALAAGNSILGKVINDITYENFTKWLAALAASDHSKICSQLVAVALAAQPELEHFAPLTQALATLTPQQLLSGLCFEPGAVELVREGTFEDIPKAA